MLTSHSMQNIDLLLFPFARNKAKIFGKALAALDVKENTDNKKVTFLMTFHVAGFICYIELCLGNMKHMLKKSLRIKR